jgi:hypothetical protein
MSSCATELVSPVIDNLDLPYSKRIFGVNVAVSTVTNCSRILPALLAIDKRIVAKTAAQVRNTRPPDDTFSNCRSIIVAVFPVLQIASLTYPVLAINSTTKAFQLLCNAVDIVLTHFSDLIEAMYAEAF